jgi:hypothetical protein
MATCTVQHHPSCTITCPKGCMAYYVEPNGPCHRRCTGREPLERIDLEDEVEISIQISDFPAAELGEMLGITKARSSEERISLTLNRTTWKEVARQVESQL